jgi:hypothetical protein
MLSWILVMKKFVRVACAALALSLAMPSGSKAASVTVDVDLTLPQVLFLYCYSDVSVTVPAQQLANLVGAGLTLTAEGTAPGGAAGDTASLGTNSSNATVSGSDLNVTLNATGGVSTTGLTTATLNLNNVCAVRGLANSAVSIAIGGTSETTLASTSSGSITVSSYTPTPTSANITLGTPTAINVAMALDLSGVTGAGNFAMSGTGNKMIVTATLP